MEWSRGLNNLFHKIWANNHYLGHFMDRLCLVSTDHVMSCQLYSKMQQNALKMNGPLVPIWCSTSSGCSSILFSSALHFCSSLFAHSCFLILQTTINWTATINCLLQNLFYSNWHHLPPLDRPFPAKIHSLTKAGFDSLVWQQLQGSWIKFSRTILPWFCFLNLLKKLVNMGQI